jgi:hypothetical protein
LFVVFGAGVLFTKERLLGEGGGGIRRNTNKRAAK